MNKQELIVRITNRAREYNWYDEAAHIERCGAPHRDFGKTVGQAVTLFAATPPLGGLLQSREEYYNERENDRIRAKRLGQLRLWIAQLDILNRKSV